MKKCSLHRKTTINRGTSQLKRSPMVRNLLKPSARTDGSVKTLKVWKTQKVKPNAEEREWMSFVADFGCVVCYRRGRGKVPCAVHHIVEGSRRLGHMWTIGLCQPGHHIGAPKDSGEVSRHPDKAEFEKRYGTEYELHAFLVSQRKSDHYC